MWAEICIFRKISESVVKEDLREKPYSVEVIAGVSEKTVHPLLPNCLELRCLNTLHTDIKRQNDPEGLPVQT